MVPSEPGEARRLMRDALNGGRVLSTPSCSSDQEVWTRGERTGREDFHETEGFRWNGARDCVKDIPAPERLHLDKNTGRAR